MMRNFSVDEKYALKMDATDPLASFRSSFYLPAGTIYLDGNSLGLLSKEAERSIKRIIDEWKNLAIKGWLSGRSPWFYLAEKTGALAAPLVGASPDEVVLTGTTTVNIHSLLATFFSPKGKRNKILADDQNFPSDIYALKGQLEIRGLPVNKHLLLVNSIDGLTLDEDEIIARMNDDITLAFFSSVLYKSGQLLDLARLIREAHRRGIIIGFDCSHSAGVVPHFFSDWNVDFALWCSYKYLNGGPGSPAFIFIHRRHFHKQPVLAGWFGGKKDKQFDMSLEFDPQPSAGGWQISSPMIFGAAAVMASLEIIKKAGIGEIRKKSLAMTEYLIFLIDGMLDSYKSMFEIVTPRESQRRGGHVALAWKQYGWAIANALKARGILPDFRPPGIIRLAPVALYNTFHEVWQTVCHLKEILDRKEYLQYNTPPDSIT